MTDSDPALSATNYTGPTHVAANTDVQALIEQAVAQALAKQNAEQQAASQPRVLSPEEQARTAIDNRGRGLGIEERLAELYELHHIHATKGGY